jgi:NodT family efflux transporter outer membrane factor (OMF) lipoprotein
MEKAMERLVLPRILILFATLLLAGCMKIGPDFVRPDAPHLSANWLDAQDSRVTNQSADYRQWWQAFNDPTLDRLIDTAHQQNLSLRIAGLRVLEARAQLGIAVGKLFPQTQQLFGTLEYNRVSERSFQLGALNNQRYEQSEIGILASWEIDFWGKFRRNIESADANWMATLADYDSALVSLTADVASLYVIIRTLEKRIHITSQNIETQKESLRIAEARFHGGTTSQRDVEQAKTQLASTQASIPVLESQLRQAKNGLSVLLGLPPGDLPSLLSPAPGIPVPPSQVAVGIPADLLRRRPDIRSAEYQAASQSAQIGVAKADLLPAFSLSGTFGFLASNVGKSALGDMFQWGSRTYVWGPVGQWNILNYGKLANNVRVQDARFQQLLVAYQNTVLKAQKEVEDALSGFLRAHERAGFLAESSLAARQSVDLATAQYQVGIVDYTAVLTAQQSLLDEQDNLATALGDVSRNLAEVYRALGGGWQIREGMDLVPSDVKETMAQRTNWGNLLSPAVYIPPDQAAGEPLVRLPDW